MSVFSERQRATCIRVTAQRPISEMCATLVGKVEIVGWRESGLGQGATHKNMSMGEFMGAHVNQQSTWNNKVVAPFYFLKSQPSGPDMVLFIRVDSTRLIPVFVQLKSYQRSTNFTPEEWKSALSTVLAPKSRATPKIFASAAQNTFTSA